MSNDIKDSSIMLTIKHETAIRGMDEVIEGIGKQILAGLKRKNEQTLVSVKAEPVETSQAKALKTEPVKTSPQETFISIERATSNHVESTTSIDTEYIPASTTSHDVSKCSSNILEFSEMSYIGRYGVFGAGTKFRLMVRPMSGDHECIIQSEPSDPRMDNRECRYRSGASHVQIIPNANGNKLQIYVHMESGYLFTRIPCKQRARVGYIYQVHGVVRMPSVDSASVRYKMFDKDHNGSDIEPPRFRKFLIGEHWFNVINMDAGHKCNRSPGSIMCNHDNGLPHVQFINVIASQRVYSWDRSNTYRTEAHIQGDLTQSGLGWTAQYYVHYKEHLVDVYRYEKGEMIPNVPAEAPTEPITPSTKTIADPTVPAGTPTESIADPTVPHMLADRRVIFTKRHSPQANGPYQGSFGNGFVKTGTCLNGYDHGTVRRFYPNGKLSRELHMDHGLPNGVGMGYHPCGALGSKLSYSAGKANGILEVWTRSGQRVCACKADIKEDTISFSCTGQCGGPCEYLLYVDGIASSIITVRKHI